MRCGGSWTGGSLYAASAYGHTGVVDRLLARDDVDVDQATCVGATPLFIASQTGHTVVVERLLARDDIDVNKAKTGRNVTPLFIASQQGHTDVVERLLARDDIDVNKAETRAQVTPMAVAIGKGHDKVVKRLLKKEGIRRIKLANVAETPQELLRYVESLGLGGDDEMARTRKTVECLEANLWRHTCAACGREDGAGNELRKCSRCGAVYYCSRACQKAHWAEHKRVCGKNARPARSRGKGRGEVPQGAGDEEGEAKA